MKSKVWKSRLCKYMVIFAGSLIGIQLIIHSNTLNSSTEERPPQNLDHLFADQTTPLKLTMCNIINKRSKSDKISDEICSPLHELTNGIWRPKNVTKEEIKKVKDYESLALKTRQITQTLDRIDGRCGDMSLLKETFSRYIVYDPGDVKLRMRALCDPDGPTPCCYKNHCVNLPVNQCQCDNCYDMRQRHHAELSQWVPVNPKCHVKHYSPNEACGILTKVFDHIVVMGDSLMRHVFSSLLVLLRTGANAGSCLKPGVSEDVKAKCHGYYQLLDKECNSFNLWRNATVCDGNLRVTMLSLESINELQTRKSELKDLKLNSKSFLIMGTGLHDDFNAEKLILGYINPTLEMILQGVNPKYHHGDRPISIPHTKDLKNIRITKNIQTDSHMVQSIYHKERISNTGYLPGKDNEQKDKSAIKHYRTLLSSDTSGDQQLLENTKYESVPKVLWLNTHLPGLLKSIHQVRQDVQHTKQFNRHVDAYLRKLCVPVMNTEELSKNVFSFDGTHYGLGMNLIKAKIILNYVAKLSNEVR
ncbi:unnamed protein product [Owenia fusiformis]|uniref:Uncharacterized protein n=1 Tax=Owenia fusiformis TaxID=6347 RepID=A0A8J1U5F5_OWEFU|nr:unnamed protein product [Owenia fusiformis]